MKSAKSPPADGQPSAKSELGGPQAAPSDETCVVHDHPIPPEEIARYSPERDPDAERDISNYVEGLELCGGSSAR